MDEKDNTKENTVEELEQRKEQVLSQLKQKKKWLIYVLMVAIAWFGYYIRTRNIPLLNGKWLPDVDSYAFLRYAEYIAGHGKIMINDTLRYYPFGFDPRGEFGILSYVIAYLEKIMHLFNTNATTVDAAILYPALSFFIAAIFFFLFVKKMLNYKAAIVATAFFAVIPAFLYRTMAGVADKEALAVAIMFAGLYFYVLALKSEKAIAAIIWGLVAGICTGVLAAVWGGYVFIIVSLGLHAIICNLFGIFKKNNIYAYSIWMFSFMIVAYICYPIRYTPTIFLGSITSQIMIIGFLMSVIILLSEIKQLAGFKDKIERKMPLGLFALIATVLIGVIFLLVTSGISIIGEVFNEVYTTITRPFATNRWQLTVAENHQPYFIDWIGQFSWKYLIIIMAGATWMFYNIIKTIKSLKKTTVWGLTAGFTIFIIALTMSRYSADSIFNGETAISQIIYIGSLITIFFLIGYGYVTKLYLNREAKEDISKIGIMLPLVLILFIIMAIAARSAIRLLFIFAPVTAVLMGYITNEAILAAKHFKKDAYKIAALILIALVILTTFYGFSKSVIAQATYVGPSFNLQWQNSMNWVKENTPKDAVFAHWWDYGYWVQWGGQRATIVDGGNAMGNVNHFVGRHILTAQNETEALEYMKSRNVTHLLAISDEIGKYPAFSSIGADRNYDRYSWISTFTMQPNQIRETRDETVYLFTGGTPLDDDFIYQGKLFPANAAGVAGVFLPVKNINVQEGNKTKAVQQLGQPEAVLVYGGQQIQVPLRCAYINGQEMLFEGKESLEGCLRVIPTIEANGQVNPLGAALYLSPEVYKGLFAKIFLLNKEYPHIKLAYSDENTGMPLAVYQGRLIGPLKIWAITYSDNLYVPPEYYTNELPDPEVEVVKR